jgi:hypothetical protein
MAACFEDELYSTVAEQVTVRPCLNNRGHKPAPTTLPLALSLCPQFFCCIDLYLVLANRGRR